MLQKKKYNNSKDTTTTKPNVTKEGITTTAKIPTTTKPNVTKEEIPTTPTKPNVTKQELPTTTKKDQQPLIVQPKISYFIIILLVPIFIIFIFILMKVFKYWVYGD